jgi:DNA replication and repair protein RecF
MKLDGHPLRRFGSQGQQRLALLALLFAERQVLLDAGRSAPLMLLDDVMSELDPGHRRLLVELLERGGGQALVTATEADHVPSSTALRISVNDGAAATEPVLRAA